MRLSRLLGIAVTLLLLAGSRVALAQLGEVRLAQTGFDYQAPVDYRGARLDFQSYRANVMVPLTVREKTTFALTNFNYQLIHANSSGGPRPASLDLHLMTISPIVVHRFSDRFMGIVQTGYGIASDLGSPLTGRDFYFTATGIGLYRLSRELTLGAGVAYDQRTGNVIPVPLGAVYWEPWRKFGIRGVLPSALFVSFRPVQPLTLQLTGSFEGQRYHVSGVVMNDSERKGSLAYSIVKVGAGARLHFTKWLHLETVAGALVMRRFEMFVDDRSRGDGFLPVGPYIGASLWVGGSGWNDR